MWRLTLPLSPSFLDIFLFTLLLGEVEWGSAGGLNGDVVISLPLLVGHGSVCSSDGTVGALDLLGVSVLSLGSLDGSNGPRCRYLHSS